MSYFARFPFQHEAKRFYPDDRIKQPEVTCKMLDFIIMYLELKKFFPEKTAVIELETRPGSIIFADKAGIEIPEHYCQLALEKVSKNGLTIVNSKMFDNKDLVFSESENGISESDRRRLKDIRNFRDSLVVSKEAIGFIEYLPGIGCKFNPAISEDAFFNRLNYFRSGTSTQLIEEKDYDLTLDLKDEVDQESRYTFDIKNNKYLKTTKRLKSNLDMIDRSQVFRTSAAIEINHEIKPEAFMSKLKLDSADARLKVRWHFEFYNRYDFSFTQTFQTRFKNTATANAGLDRQIWNTIFNILKIHHQSQSPSNSKLGQEIIRVFESLEIKPNYEIECEYKDIGRLAESFYQVFDETVSEGEQVFRKNYFVKNVSEFFLNSELLFQMLTRKKRTQETDEHDQMHFNEYKKFFRDHRITAIEYPFIGEYLEEVLVRRKRAQRKIQQAQAATHPHRNGNHRPPEESQQAREQSAPQPILETAADPRKQQMKKKGKKLVEENWERLT